MQYNINNTNNTQDTNNMEENTMKETMKVITNNNGALETTTGGAAVMKAFADMCVASTAYTNDDEKSELYGTFLFGINDADIDVRVSNTFMTGLEAALEILTCCRCPITAETTITLDMLDNKGGESTDTYNFIAWLYVRCTHGDTPINRIAFTGGQYSIIIDADPERIRMALIQMCIKVADESNCRNVLQFIAEYSDIYTSTQIDDHYSVLYAFFAIDTFQSFENMYIPCGIFSIADNNMEECQYNLHKAIETMFDWSSHYAVYKTTERIDNAYVFNNTKYVPIFVGGAENMLIAYEDDRPVRCMFFATGSDDAAEIDKSVRIEIANDFMRKVKQVIPAELLEDMPRLPEMLLMFEQLQKNSSYKAPEKWEIFAARNAALNNALTNVYNIWRTAVPKSFDEEALDEFNDRHILITDTNGTSACLSTSPTLCEDLINLAMHLYDEL